MNAVAQIVALWLQRGFALVRSVGPYALIEILLPGGTLIALLLWLARQGAFSTRAGSIELMPAHYSKRLDPPIAVRVRCGTMKRAWSGLLTVALGCSSVASAAEVTLHACELPGVKRAAKCGTVEVPENPDKPQGRPLQLGVAVIPAENPGAHDDPIVPLMGGPGEDAISSAEYYVSTIGPLLKDRDLLLIDQRGTGKSNALRCKLYDPKNSAKSLHDLFPADAVARCAKELSTRADLTQYTYPHLARDLEHVRQTLGYGQLNITAGSYGTRAAQVYLRMFPQSVRTVYLGSVVPLDVTTPLTMARTAEDARNKTFDACAADAACRAAFPNLRAEIEEVGRQLESGKTPFDRGRVAEWFRSLTYRPYSATDLPWLIHRAHTGDWQPIEQGILENAAGADAALSLGLLFSITCNDDVAFITEPDIARETRGTFLRDYRVRQQQAACRQWPKNPTETDRTPVKSTVPTLFVSGDSDAATPLWFTARVAAGFSQRAEVVAAGQGHTEWSECVAGFYEQLVRDGSIRNLRGTTCDAIPRPPFKTH
jgi:pimeloyl-ACP methyl ester carboxylesterase